MTTIHGPARDRTTPKPPSEPRLRVVPAASRHRPRAPFVVLVVALMALGLVGLLLINTTMQRGAFQLTELQDKAATLQKREQALQLDVAAMSSPDHIATQAARLGMVPNASPAFLRLPDGKIIGNPSPALPGTNLPALPGSGRVDGPDASRTEGGSDRDDAGRRADGRGQERDERGRGGDRDEGRDRGGDRNEDRDRGGERNRDRGDDGRTERSGGQ